jgi:predicted transcriptional regulator
LNRTLNGIRADRKYSYFAIEQVATELRKMLGASELDRFDAFKFFEEVIPEMTIECGVGTVALCQAVDDLEEEGRTKWDPISRRIEVAVSGATYDLLQRNQPRALYTVAHEVGHACLHTEQVIRMGEMSVSSQLALHRNRSQHEAYQDTEWQANAFASAILMPAEGVDRVFARRGRISALALTETYGVSIEAATYRVGTYERSLGRK